MGRKYVQATAGEWIRPVKRGYRMRCCDCGLVHRRDTKIRINGKNLNTLIKKLGGNFTLYERYYRNRKLTKKERHEKEI